VTEKRSGGTFASVADKVNGPEMGAIQGSFLTVADKDNLEWPNHYHLGTNLHLGILF